MAEEQKTYPRFSVAQRVQHWVMTISFAVLAITGLPQRYALAGWAEWMIEAMGGIETVRIIHRLSAVVLILVTVFHFVSLAYTVFVKRSRMTLLPGLKDVTDLLDSVRYSLGLAQRHPRFPHFSVAEKIEYWALIWGTVVMIITGFMLWNPIATTRFLPGEFVPAAKAALVGGAGGPDLALLRRARQDHQPIHVHRQADPGRDGGGARGRTGRTRCRAEAHAGTARGEATPRAGVRADSDGDPPGDGRCFVCVLDL